MGRSGSGLGAGYQWIRAVWLWRPGFYIHSGDQVLGQSLPEVHWTGANLDAHSLCSSAGNGGCWKRFGSVDVKMTCVPDPATGSGGPPPIAGTGISIYEFSASCNQYQPVVSISTNGAQAGSGQDARFQAPFPIYVISDNLVVNIDSDSEVKVTETVLLGYVDGGGNQIPGTMYTITLVGHWSNGRFASDVFAAAWALWNNPAAAPSLNQQQVSLDTNGVLFADGFEGFGGNQYNFIARSDWPGVLPVPGDLTTDAWFGYYQSQNHEWEQHMFFGSDGVVRGPFETALPVGSRNFVIRKFNVTIDGQLSFDSDIPPGHTYFSNDRFIGEPDGTKSFYVPIGDISIEADNAVGTPYHF